MESWSKECSKCTLWAPLFQNPFIWTVHQGNQLSQGSKTHFLKGRVAEVAASATGIVDRVKQLEGGVEQSRFLWSSWSSSWLSWLSSFWHLWSSSSLKEGWDMTLTRPSRSLWPSPIPFVVIIGHNFGIGQILTIMSKRGNFAIFNFRERQIENLRSIQRLGDNLASLR